jgi:hypothetical protein
MLKVWSGWNERVSRKRSDSVGEITKEPKLQSVMFLFAFLGCCRTRQQGGQD